MVKKYKICEILHSGKHGERYSKKEGKKYEERKKDIIYINLDNYQPGDDLIIGKSSAPYLFKITYVFSNEDEQFFYLETVNSIYKLKEVKEEVYE